MKKQYSEFIGMDVLNKEYQEHQVFTELEMYYEYYEALSSTVMGFITTGTKSFINIDSYIFSSMQGTIDSIKTILKNGRINDAYSLLRKYYDSVIINIYSNLYLQDHKNLGNFIVEQIDDWLNGKKQLPEYRIMSDYIKKSDTLKPIFDLIDGDDTYKKVRNRCNDNTHYNFYYNVLLNDNEVRLPYRVTALTQFTTDLRNIFILHFSCLFFLNQHYMSSTDYIDYLDCDLKPPDGYEYWVAPFIQEVFNKIIKVHRIDIANVLLDNTCMMLK